MMSWRGGVVLHAGDDVMLRAGDDVMYSARAARWRNSP